jgi:hypothetical protein
MSPLILRFSQGQEEARIVTQYKHTDQVNQEISDGIVGMFDADAKRKERTLKTL